MISSRTADQLLADVDVVDPGGETGRGSGGATARPVVALAHGAGGGVLANFGSLIEGDPARRYLGPSYPGAGRTPRASEALDINTLADQVVASAVQAGAERFPVLGLSLGGAVAATAAVRHPDHVSALILTMPLLRPDAQSLTFTAVWRALAASDDIPTLAKHILHSVGTAEALEALGPQNYQAAADEIARTYPAGGSDHAELTERVDLTPHLDAITVPTLVIIGSQDRILLPQTCAGYVAIRGAEVIDYPDAGHIIGPDLTSRWLADITTFLDRV